MFMFLFGIPLSDEGVPKRQLTHVYKMKTITLKWQIGLKLNVFSDESINSDESIRYFIVHIFQKHNYYYNYY